jgi:hypothetical protein
MSNVLSEEKKQQVIALGKLGWPLRRIEQATGVRRETASAHLKDAGIAVRLPRFWGKRMPAKPAIVTPDSIAPFSQKPGAPLPGGRWPPQNGCHPQAAINGLFEANFAGFRKTQFEFGILIPPSVSDGGCRG